MKLLRTFAVTAAFLLVTTGMASARLVRTWSHQELLDKSDLVVIATPTATNDTKEHIPLPGYTSQPVNGVETKFEVSAVLKGEKVLRNLVLHHYRVDAISVDNGPMPVSFNPAEKRTFLLYLVREPDGRYAPAFGQVDPGLGGIYVLGRAGEAEPADKLIDDKLAANAQVVLRVKRLSPGDGDKFSWYRVEVLQVLKNQSGEAFTNTLSVAAYSWKEGVPDGESTLYLEQYNKTDKGLWQIVGGEASTGVSHVKIPQHAPYEIVLDGENIVFDKAESVSSRIIIRNLGVQKLSAPDLYWGLAVVWDGKEYKRDPKRIGTWNGPGEIIPKGVFSTGISLSEYLVPAEVLTAGRHTIALKDASADSNTLTIFIEPKKP